jgi:hypothetical protein
MPESLSCAVTTTFSMDVTKKVLDGFPIHQLINTI